jgi:hypothetical protein
MTTSLRPWCQVSLIACAALLSVTSAEAQGYRELSVVPRQDTGIDLFAVASGASIEHRFRDEGEPEADFAGVEPLTGEATDIAALELPDGRYELFIVDRNESLWHSWQQPDSFEWAEWQLLDNATKKVSIARDASGRVELFEIGSDDALWHRGRAADAEPTDFGEWFRLETLGSQLAATAADGGGFEVAVIGQDGAILAQHFGADGQPDAEQENLGGVSFDVALATLPGGGYSLVAVGTVEDPWERRYVNAEQGWLEWQSLPVSANRVALVDTDAGLTLYGIANGAIVSSQLTAADADWTEARVALDASAFDSELQGRARLIIPSLDVDQDVPVTIGLRFNVDGTVEIRSFPTVVTDRFDTPFGATTSTISLPRSGIGELRREDGVLRLPVTLRFDQSLDLPIIAEDGNLSLDLSSDNADGGLLDAATGEVSLSAQGSFEGDGSTNPLDGQSCQVIVSGVLSPAP